MLCLTQHLEWHMEMACHRLESATIWVQGQKGLGSRWCEKSTVQSRQRQRDEGSRKFQGTLRFVLRLRALHWELCNSADSNLCLNLAPWFIKTYQDISRHIKTYQDEKLLHTRGCLAALVQVAVIREKTKVLVAEVRGRRVRTPKDTQEMGKLWTRYDKDGQGGWTRLTSVLRDA